MKHLLLILLFVPFISIGQIKTLDEIKRITSQETFERVCIENGYEKSKELMVIHQEDCYIVYALNPTFNDKNEILSQGFAVYYTSEKEMNSFRFNFENSKPYDYNENYDNIFDEVKSNCDYLDISERKNIAFSTYDCLPNGKLGFGKRKGINIIHYFPKKTP